MAYLNCIPFLVLFIRKFAVLFVFIFPVPLTSQLWVVLFQFIQLRMEYQSSVEFIGERGTITYAVTETKS